MIDASGRTAPELRRDLARLAAALEPLPPLRRYPLARELRVIARTLERSRQLLLQAPAAERLRISEWMLDNDYVVEQAIDQVASNLPRHFFKQLPSAHRPAAGKPRLRVSFLAEALLDAMEGHLWPEQLEDLVRSFDQHRPLSMGELWALPTVLRWVLLDRLSQLAVSIQHLIERDAADQLTGRNEATVAQIIVSLRAIDGYDWRKFFEQTSAVERVLGNDPAGIYGQMDFATRDRYRKRVEQLARHDPRRERQVADQAIALARTENGAREDSAREDGARQRHVGYFLLDLGLERLEQALDLSAPSRIRIGRFHQRHGPWFLVGTVALGSLAWSLALGSLALFLGAPWWLALVSGLLALIPGGNAAMSLTTFMSSQVLEPQVLPRLGFERRGIPPRWQTLVVVPALVGSRDELKRLFADLELNRLRNPDPNLSFALLADFADADQPSLPADQALLDAATAIVEDLNARHDPRHGGGFYLFYRPRQWNPGEGRWMAWERKRGKLHELNQWLRGAQDTSFARVEGRNQESLQAVKLVLTLDSDTVLPRGSAARLVGTLAHPLNRAEFDDRGRVIAGYSILQPRVEVDPRAANRSRFSRIYSGETGLDLYTNASSDVYQDLFGEGIYAGKGLYDVDAFERSLAGRAPANSLLSHDLFEGIHGRAALVSDVTVLEDFPPSVIGHMRRLHRWVRGDWQLIPWLRRSVPRAAGGVQRNRLALLDRYKIFDNLRRSLVAPVSLALLFLGWFGLPRAPWLWTLVMAASFGFPVAFAGLGRLIPRVRGAARAELVLRLRSLVREVRPHAGRWLLALVFLPYEAYQSLDAIVRTLVRVWFTRRNLLEWTTAAHHASGPLGIGATIRSMSPSLALMAAGAALLLLRPTADWAAVVLISAWLVSPFLALWLSRETEDQAYVLRASEKRALRRMARRTWLFYEKFVGPDDHWLPPDNYQEDPRSVIAHRTSPTNVGMLLLSTVAAHDLGYVSTADLQSRLRSTFDSLDRLEQFRGHWLNWYETQTLAPLAPRYVSTVDSGNLAAALLVVAASCRQAADRPSASSRLKRGLADTLGVLDDIVREIGHAAAVPDVERATHALSREITQSLPKLESAVSDPAVSSALITTIGELAVELAEVAAPYPVEQVRDLPIWIERLSHHFELITRERDATAGPHSDALAAGLLELERRALASVESMGFDFLYDDHRDLFRIGFNLDADVADPNFYDLLASESRIASLIAIAKGDAPEKHWLHLGRPLTRIGNRRVLLSWGATMFEYLMPLLFMPSPQRTLLRQSCESAVQQQRKFARRHRIPWGISESAFFQFDAQSIYQYRAFGVTGLGLKRDLGDRLVVAPYATFLALPLTPRAALANLERLRDLDMLGRYGWYESVDFGLPKLRAPHRPRPVRSYMAHHQGMIMAAIDNLLSADVLSARLMSDPRLSSTALLLHERRPEGPALRTRRAFDPRALQRQPTPPSFSWRVAPAPGGKQCHVISNSRMSVIATSAGGLGIRHRGQAVTRFSPDHVREPHGGWFYLQDLESGELWTTGEPTAGRADDRYEMTASPSEIRYLRRRQGIAARLEMTVLPRLDLLIERLILVNESARARKVAVTSYHEIVLAPTINDRRHPAFNKLFVTGEYRPRDRALVFSRRACAPGPAMPSAAFQVLAPRRAAVSWCASREVFLGRGGSLERPAALGAGGGLTGSAGPSLDPVAAFRVELDLPPRAEVEMALLCAIGDNDADVQEALATVPSLAAIPAAFDRSQLDNEIALHDLEIAPAHLPLYQQLHSRLTYSHRSSPPAVRSFPRPRLWHYGVSGDHPVLLLETAELDHLPFVRQLLLAHAWWRRQGIEVDLVVVDRLSHGYEQPLRDRLSKAIDDTGGGEWVGRRGGLHLLAGGVVGEDLPGLEQIAAVVLRTDSGPLDHQIRQLDTAGAGLPAFVPTQAGATAGDVASEALAPVLDRPADLLLDNGLGGFSADGHSYVLHLEPGQHTPAPWCNVLANPEFGCLVSESSLGCTWALNSHENRLTPWRNDPVLDEPSEVVYLRDEETGEVWAATPRPGPADATYQVRHAQGFSEYRHVRHGFDQRLRVFVAPTDPVKLVELQLENHSARPRRLTVTYYCEWVLGTMAELSARHVAGAYDAERSCLLVWNPASDDFAERVAFLAASEPAHGLTTDRSEFLGHGGLSRPSGLGRIGLSGNADRAGDPCGALQVHLDLAPGASLTVHFALGQGRDRDHALELAERFRQPATTTAAFDQVMGFWSERRSRLQVATPDVATNLMLNGWLLYQTVSSRLWGRSSLYQAGGAFGFRDQLQDVLSLLLIEPKMARKHIAEACARQFTEGDVLHWWHPPDGRGLRSRCSDDLLWLPWATAEYVDATGDLDLLDQEIPFLTGPVLGDTEVERYDLYPSGSEAASVYEHCLRALDRAMTEGRHGLPLIGASDWNDGFSHVGRSGQGESVWLAWFLIATLERFAPLCLRRADASRANALRQRASRLRETVQASAWDGEWYCRAFDDDGTAIGSRHSDECQIDLIAQAWSVLAHGGRPERAERAMESAYARLVAPGQQLIKLLQPPFDQGAGNPGYIKGYPPGIRENGGQYTHAAVWGVWAWAELGPIERLGPLWQGLLPPNHACSPADVGRYRVEPYVAAADIYSAEPWVGRGGWTWYTGSAAWLYRLGIERLLGLVKRGDRLHFMPALPPEWSHCQIDIPLGQARYRIVLEAPSGGTQVVSTRLDGVEQAGSSIQLDDGAGQHEVVVVVAAGPAEPAVSP